MLNLKRAYTPKFWFDNDLWYFCSITKSGWFWKRLSRKSSSTITSQSHFRSSRTRMSFKIVVLKYFLIFTLKRNLKETSTQVFSCEYCQIFTDSCCYRTPPMASVDLLFLIKNNVGWLLLKRFIYLVRVCYLHVSSRNHSNTLLLIILQKRKICPKWSTAAKAICSDIRILTV